MSGRAAAPAGATARASGAPGPAAAPGNGRDTRVLLLGIVALALGLRVGRLGATNLWLDESNSWYVATFPLGRILGELQTIPGAAFHAPFYFVLLKLWIEVAGDGEAAMRTLSVLLSVALLPVVYALGARLLSREAGLLAALLLALSPAQIFFAQEVRMYAALALLTTGAALACAAWWTAESTRGRSAAIAAYALLAVLALYTHYSAALPLAALNVHALWALAARGRGRPWRDRRAWAWAATQVVVAVAFLPYVTSVDRAAAAASQGWRVPLGWEGSLRELLRFPLELAHGLYHHAPELQRRAAAFWAERGSSGAAARLRESVLVFPLLVLVLVTVLAHPPRPRRGGVPAPQAFLYLGLVLPLAVGVWVSVGQGLQFSRYFLFAAPFLALLLAGGLLRLRLAWRAVALAVLLAGAGYGLARYWEVDVRDSDYRPVGRFLAERARPGDEIVALPADNHVSLLYYLRDTGLESRSLAPERLEQELGSGGGRTWLVIDYRSPLYGVPPRALRETLGREVLVERRFGGGAWGVLLVGLGSERG